MKIVNFYCFVSFPAKEEFAAKRGLENYALGLKNALNPLLEKFHIVGNDFFYNSVCAQEQFPISYYLHEETQQWRLTL
ncbi:hypothetical protein CYV15_10095, partial [Riemerella anatipestifer]|uniref:hypothetical protein n=1 Tax=Riemerella anatipestifer TaxID=34085 RepID=UPI000DD2711A